MAKTPKKNKIVEKDLRQYLNLDVDQRRLDIAERRASFATQVRKKDPIRAAIAFKSFVAQERIVGLQRVLNGDPLGWVCFDRFLLANWVAVEAGVVEARYQPATNLLHARSVGLEWLVRDSARQIATDLRSGFFSDPTAPHRARWRLPRFALWLTQRDTVVDAPYDIIAGGWNDETSLVTGLVTASEYHLTETPWASKLIGAEFANYSTQPIEVWAVQETRRLEGRTTPVVDHPMIQTAFATRPPMMYQPAADEELQALLGILGIELPG